jgi:hypothetical protein
MENTNMNPVDPDQSSVERAERRTPQDKLPTIKEMSGLVEDMYEGKTLEEYLKDIRGEPVSVEVQKPGLLGEGKLPTTSDLTGCDPEFTGDLSTEEFIRRVRRG